MNIKTAGDVFGQASLVNLITDLQNGHNNSILSAPGLAITGAGTATVKNTNTFSYFSAGFLKSKATANYAFTPGVHDIPANAASIQERCYAVMLNAAGAATITAGNIAAGAGLALMPEYPVNGNTPIGAVRIAVAAGATPFTGNTILLDAAALTVTYYDGYPVPTFTSAQ